MTQDSQKIEKILKTSAIEIKSNPKKMQKTIRLSQKVILDTQKSQEISMFEFLLVQMKFITKGTWIAQIFIFVSIIFGIFLGVSQGEKQIGLLFTVMAPMMILFSIPELCKNIRYQTTEVEVCSRFGLKKVYLARFILLGMTDLCMATILILLGSANYSIPFYELAIQFLVPYNSVLVVCFLVMSFKRIPVSDYMVTAAGILWTVVLFAVTKFYHIYENVQLLVWCVLLLLSCLYIGFAGRQIMENSKHYTEVDYVRN